MKRFCGKNASYTLNTILAIAIVLLASAGIGRGASSADLSRAETENTSTEWVRDFLQGPSISPGVDFEHLTIEDGLPHNAVFCILQDRKGFMWFGTLDGLTRFDGYEFVVYSPDSDDPSSLSDNAVLAIVEDRNGDLWVGTGNGGVNRFNQETKQFHQYNHQPDDTYSLSSNNILSIYEDNDGTLWIGTSGGGLNRYDSERDGFIRFQNDPTDSSTLESNNVSSIFEDQSGTLWIGTIGGGLSRLVSDASPFVDENGLSPSGSESVEDSPGKGKFVAYRHDPRDPFSISQDDVYAIFEDRLGRIWVGTGDGSLNLFDQQTGHFKQYPLSPGEIFDTRQNPIRQIVEDPSGKLWIGVDHEGLFHFDPDAGTFDHYSSDSRNPKSLSTNNVRAIHINREGLLWVGTYGGGLNKHHLIKKHFNYYRHDPDNPNSLSEDEVSAIYEDRSGILWVGTYGGGLNRYDRERGEFTHILSNPDNPSGLNVNIILSILEDSLGNLWVGTGGGGLNRYDRRSGSFIQYLHDPEDPTTISGNTIGPIYEDRLGSLWVGTYGDGLNRFDQDSGQYTNYTHSPGDESSLSSNDIQSIYEDRNGYLWIGTNNGLNRYQRDTNKFKRYFNEPENPDSLGDDDVLSIYEDRSGVLYIGTNGSGLDQFNRELETYTHYETKDGLADQIIYGILEDRRGYLWLSTSKGISRFDPGGRNFKNYDVSDGLPTSGFNANAYYQNDRGEMYFGGLDGFVSFFPETIRDDSYIPSIALTRLSQGGESLDLVRSGENLDEVTLRWPNDFFEFEFVALSFVKPENNKYAYKLEGYDEDWSYVDGERSGSYSDLPGGAYTLRLIGSNHDGIWNNEGLAIRIKVVPPFWETNWFQVGLTLLLVFGVVAGYRLRVRGIQLRTRELEETVRQRTYEVERRRQVAEGMGEIMVLLNSNKSLKESLNFIVTRASELTYADYAFIFRGRDTQSVGIVANYSPHSDNRLINQSHLDGLASWLGEQTQSGEPYVNSRVDRSLAGTTDIQPVQIFNGWALMCLPIKVGDEIYGGFALIYNDERSFSDEDIDLGVLISDQTALAIGNARLRERAQEMAVVEERNRLARDLHDAVTQTLFSASLIAEALPDLWQNDPAEGFQLLDELKQLSRGALAEMRTLLLELRPAGVADIGLDDLLRQLAESTAGRTGMMIKLEVVGEFDLDPNTREVLYRIAQEALNNVVKHANANNVSFHLQGDSLAINRSVATLTLTVEDDGCGFIPDLDANEQLGLSIMRERAESIGASLVIDSLPGCGTQVIVKLIGEDR